MLSLSALGESEISNQSRVHSPDSWSDDLFFSFAETSILCYASKDKGRVACRRYGIYIANSVPCCSGFPLRFSALVPWHWIVNQSIAMTIKNIPRPGALQQKSDVAERVNETPVEVSTKTWWQRRAPVIACGSGLFSDGYLNGV